MMSSQSFDAAQFKEQSRQQWDSVAPAWRRWWSTIEEGAQETANLLVDLAQIDSGDKVLDIATGIGEPALTAAKKVGPTGQITVTDMSEEMLEIARERFQDASLENVSFQRIDAENLDLPKSNFNAALCRWGLTELPNPQNAIQEIYGCLVDGGRFATAVWDAPPNVPLLGAPAMVVMQMFNPPLPPEGTPSPFGLANIDAVKGMFSNAGFQQVESQTQRILLNFPTFDAYRDFLNDISPMIQGMLGSQPTEKQAEAWQAIAESLKEYKQNDESYQIPASTHCIAGQKST